MITLAGGTGLVGKSLTQALVRDGEQVRVLTRDPDAAAAAFGDAKLEIVGVDIDASPCGVAWERLAWLFGPSCPASTHC